MSSREADAPYAAALFARMYGAGALPGGGVTRLGYTPAEDALHEVFEEAAREQGLRVRTDGAGNTFASAAPEGAPVYLIASHLDSVVEGGRYDGAAGALAALLVTRMAQGSALPVAAGAFRCEESSRFGLATLGSGLVTGKYRGRDAAAARGRDGEMLGDVFAARGLTLEPPLIQGVKAYLELHIEQGRVLEECGERLGVVSAIAGYRRFRVRVAGRADHSGATPMDLRCDALCAAAELALAIEKAGRDEAASASVAAVTAAEFRPNVVNVIPGEALLTVDTRGVDEASIARMEARIREAGEEVCARRGAAFSMARFASSAPVPLSSALSSALEDAARALGVSARRMTSGAGHDAMNFPPLCDAALLFIPCRGGISHNKDEWASLDDICLGARVLYECIRRREGLPCSS